MNVITSIQNKALLTAACSVSSLLALRLSLEGQLEQLLQHQTAEEARLNFFCDQKDSEAARESVVFCELLEMQIVETSKLLKCCVTELSIVERAIARMRMKNELWDASRKVTIEWCTGASAVTTLDDEINRIFHGQKEPFNS
jgi:hypothetical protein